MSAGFDLPTITRGLAALRRRARTSLGLQGGATLAVLVVTLCLISFGLDRILRLSWEARATGLVTILTALGWVIYSRLFRPLQTPLADVELARLVEREHPQLEWKLLSAVQFADPAWSPGPETSRELAGLVVADAEQLAREVAFEAPVPGAPMARSALRGAAVLAAGALLLGSFPGPAHTWFERNVLLSTTAQWPQDTLLTIESPTLTDGVLRLARGEDLTFAVRAEGVIPSRVYLDTTSAEGGRERLVFDALGDGTFRTTLEQVSESFTFSIWGGDAELGPFEAEVVRRPWITGLTFKATPPAYTGQDPAEFGVEAGAVSLPVDSRVAVEIQVSKPLVRAWLEERRAGEDVARIHTGVLVADAKGFSAELTLDRAGPSVFQVQVEGRDGYGFGQATRFNLIAQSDASPQLELRLLGVGLNVTAKAKVRFEVDASDDYGLTAGTLHFRGAGGDEEAGELLGGLPFDEVLQGKPQATPVGVLDLGSLELEPKMALTLWAEATDADPRGPNTGASPSHQLRIVTPEQLLNELLRRLHEQRLELERMISEEEKLAQGLSGSDETTLERAARTHADVSRAVVRAADVVAGVVDELVSNDLLEKNVWDRLRDQVVAELRRVAAGPLEEARGLAEAAQHEPEGESRGTAMRQAGSASLRVISELRAIVARMGDIEDMAELVAMLKKIIEQQRGLMDETKRKRGE